MRIFHQNRIREAVAYARGGGQALHLHRLLTPRAPACFVKAVERGETIAHLFDMDLERLKVTAHELGVKVIVVEHEGTIWQHVDLCGKPLEKAKARAGALYA